MAFTPYEGHFLEQIGINRQMVMSGAAETAIGPVSGTINAYQSWWNEDYTGFQNLAGGISTGIGGLTTAMSGIAFGLATHSTMPTKSLISATMWNPIGKNMFKNQHVWEAAKVGKGIYLKDEAGGFSKLVGGELKAAAQMTEKRFKKGASGFLRGTSLETATFMKRPFMLTWGGGLATLAASVLLPWGIGKTLGLAGQLLDESHLAYQQSKYHSYDNRQFNNRSLMGWGMQMQEAAQSTLIPFEQNMMSIARLYHR